MWWYLLAKLRYVLDNTLYFIGIFISFGQVRTYFRCLAIVDIIPALTTLCREVINKHMGSKMLFCLTPLGGHRVLTPSKGKQPMSNEIFFLILKYQKTDYKVKPHTSQLSVWIGEPN